MPASYRPTDSYTGDVAVGGPAHIRTLEALTITKVAVGPMENNSYVLTCRATGKRCLVDAAADAPRLLQELGDEPLAQIVTTHRHRDHWGALADVVAATSARTLAGAYDVAGIDVPTDVPLEDGAHVTVGDVALEVIRLAGHTPGSVALLYRDPAGPPHLLTGDSLFPGGPGRTWSPADFASLMDDLEEKIFGVLPDSTWFYPGHGKDSTLGSERPALADWRARGW